MFTPQKYIVGVVAIVAMIFLVWCFRADAEALIPSKMVGQLIGYPYAAVVYDEDFVAHLCFDNKRTGMTFRRCTSVSVKPEDMLEVCTINPHEGTIFCHPSGI